MGTGSVRINPLAVSKDGTRRRRQPRYFGFNFLPTSLTGFLIHTWEQTKKVTGAGISRFSSVFPHLFFAYPNPAYLIHYI
ncbi:hypothetical protein Y032_0329g2679 [Ancylostoma ceylanicum]|uniref:Uncharacterized protein n=1 Tax=Ancylostoma ceylanicum TaxID=53326 RepID=A0A016RZI8_9BILA|nr:hypothetical protein Y032_0329g2679 [Ancylostoma ceylanicum]